MDPNSSPWAYAYNRIVPSASGSSDDFQHPHLTSISTAAGTSAQSLLLQAAHSSIAGFNATSGNFVPPSPIGGYNPVFQQIYHHAAQAAVQPKPAHYASSAVSTSHRQIGIPGPVEKHENCRSQPVAIGYTSNQGVSLSAPNYYAENSSSSGASPSPTTSVTASTTLSWNTSVVGAPQQMSTNSFLAVQQQQHQQQQQQQQQQQNVNPEEKVNNSKQVNLHSKAQSKSYGDLIYIGNHEQQHDQVTIQIDNQIIHAVSEENCNRPEECFYTFVDGKLTYNITAAAINSASGLVNKFPASSPVKVVTPRKQTSINTHQSAQQQSQTQIPSPAYPVYESPSLCSSVGSPPPSVSTAPNSEATNNSSHIIVYKSNTPTQQAQTPLDVSTVSRGANISNDRNNNYERSSVSNNPLSPATGVVYSSVITSALQAQQQQLHQQHQHLQQSDCWLTNSAEKLIDNSKHGQKFYSVHSPSLQENNLYVFPSSLQIKQTIIESALQNVDSTQDSTQLHQQTTNTVLQVPSPQTVVDKQQQMKQHSSENVLTANISIASQIQNTTKIEEVQKPITTKKTPRKRQPKKTLLPNNDYLKTPQQNSGPIQAQAASRQQHSIQHHPTQQHQSVQIQQQNSSFYDYNNRWTPQKFENNVSGFGNQPPHQPLPQPAHVQSPQTHGHISQVSQYYPAFPQQVSTQYAACMNQNPNVYNLTPLPQDHAQESQQAQQSGQQSQSLQQQQNNSIETQSEATESTTYKVIVPNIEDELHFLSNVNSKPNIGDQLSNSDVYSRDINQLNRNAQIATVPNSYQIFEKKSLTTKKSGFMDSYLKFLQGERDESPPPMIKTGRKFNYLKSTGQADSIQSNKRKSIDINQTSTISSAPAVEAATSVPVIETSVEPIVNNEGMAIGSDDAHKIKIISQTQILPKKRPQAQNIAAAIQQNQENSQQRPSHAHSYELQSTTLHQRQNQQQSSHQDPLALPPRREQSLRKAKSRSINEIMQTSPLTAERDEPEEFADSDADPVWTPQDDDSGDVRLGNLGAKRKIRRVKASTTNKKIRLDTENDNVKQMPSVSATPTTLAEVTTTSGSHTVVDNFKTGDFIVLRADLVNDWPIIWQVDSKCILQKYEPFCQNGKMFYRNMSKYASWNLDTKKLYLKAPVRIQIQSHTETIVEFMRTELLADDTEQFIEKIMEDYLNYRDHFEIYIQTMISQVLDPSFLSEINREKDEYFLSSVRAIDGIMENCKRKLLSITPWTRSVIVSIETWPRCHVFTEWGQNNVNQKNCGGCHQPGISVRFLLFGHPYNTNTMQTIPVDMRVAYEKDILLCRICAARADIFHKIAHEKHNLFFLCTRRVEEQQKDYPGKSSTEILNDLLAENNWVDELFRNMRSSWAEVESLERQKRFYEVSQ